MSDNRGILLLKYILHRVKAFFTSKDALSFLFFLFLAASFWFANAVSKDREANVTIPVRYVEIPSDVVITNTPPTEIKVNVKDKGLNLFSYSRKRMMPLYIDLSNLTQDAGSLKIASDQIHTRLTTLLRPTTAILYYTPDLIDIEYQKLDKKIVPVKLEADIELQHQYIFSDTIRISPDKVTVYAKKEILDTLRSVKTELVSMKNLKDSVSFKASLMSPAPEANLSTDLVDVDIKVEMFTEKKVHLPVVFINPPRGFELKAFPAYVDVTYNIGLSHYNTPGDNMMVVVDYNDIKRNRSEKQKVKVVYDSPKIFNVRATPEEIEFIIEEQTEE